MIILGKPYISDFLLNTLETNEIPVINNHSANELNAGRKLNLLSENEVIRQAEDAKNKMQKIK